MLNFPQDFFKSELRNDFQVSEIMKRCWAAQIKIMYEIDQLCRRHSITYYAFYGTLLGTIRHQGFIPWDDDVDFAFKKDDYVKFLQYAQEELSDHLTILNIYTDDEWNDIFSRVINIPTINIADEFVDEWYGFPFSVGVDLFPLNYIPRDAEAASMQVKLLKMIGTVSSIIEYQNGRTGTEADYAEVNTAIAEHLVQLEHFTGYYFDTDRPILKQLDILYDQLGSLYDESESDYLTFIPKYIEKGVKYPKQWFTEALQKPFENISLSVPNGYDAILTYIYKNYMNPWKGGAAHDYPYFKEDLNRIGETMETMDLMSKLGVEGDLSFRIDKEERFLSESEIRSNVPDEWADMILGDSGGERKKILFYYTGAAALLANAQRAVKKIKWVIDSVSKDGRYVLWWFPCSLDIPDLSVVKKMMPDFTEEYQTLIEEFKQQQLGICDESGDLERALKVCDLFYGDKGVVESLFEQAGKPVMIENYGIMEA